MPQDFKIKITKSGGGIEYIDPMNEHTRIRVMPGKPHSTNPCQQNPYVIYMKDGKAFTIQGQLVRHTGPETHIPLKEFVYEKK
ncbi:MAG: hypothetical protein JSR76_01030 [Verrucomicrobia bacterium]|nr:hypothetical protein [Verrucomicrobiota bacterium]